MNNKSSSRTYRSQIPNNTSRNFSRFVHLDDSNMSSVFTPAVDSLCGHPEES